MRKGEHDHKLNFPDDDTEVYPAEKKFTSEYIGVFYYNRDSEWRVCRWSRNESKNVFYGYYDNEKTAARASDTLARQLMEKGERHKLNFPDDHKEVHPAEKNFTSEYFGVSYHKRTSRWIVTRWSRNEKKYVYYGYCDDEETAARASDTLAKELMRKGEHGHKLNFPDDYTEVHPANQKKKRKRPDSVKDN